jgi:hypothetical protein
LDSARLQFRTGTALTASVGKKGVHEGCLSLNVWMAAL